MKSDNGTYLADPVTARGKNSYARQYREVRDKLDGYSSLLGRALPDPVSRAEQLHGAFQAAELVERVRS